ncbi:MAG: branched-chain amino acid ABC transporter substrate-binding protein, partial [Burkholderiales bacterium]|nr:branched-chain amino acid ABC transporter substrate-binding protein [Burkholderiales bacterium]
MGRTLLSRIATGCLLLGWALAVGAADPIRVAHMDPLSGPFALIGESDSRLLQAAIDDINARGGVLGGTKLELVRFDNKGSPQEAMLNLKQIIDSKIRFISLGTGSHVAHALLESLNKHNSRNPDQAVLLLNIAAQDPPLTNEKCSFWHFRWEAHTDMRVKGLTDFIAAQKAPAKVYLINQDYSFGQAISKAAREMLAKKRPDIQIVGDDLHPLGKVKDFAPYIAKIKASGADTVLSGNWGSDLALLIKAAEEVGLKATFYTNYAYLVGTPRAFGGSGAERVKTVASWFPNLSGSPMEKTYLEYKKKNDEDWGFLPIKYTVDMWAKAIDKAGSADPEKVARALEDMRYDAGVGESWMRADDHQITEPLFVASFKKAGRAGVMYVADGTGYGWGV